MFHMHTARQMDEMVTRHFAVSHFAVSHFAVSGRSVVYPN